MSGGKENQVRVAIIGGGLVGAVNACFFAKRGFHVDLYEARKDIREEVVVPGKSINLALSCRGRAALHAVGLEKTVVENGIPMHARMIHGVDGNRKPIPYGKKDQYIMSISRRLLNEELLSAADKYSNVTLHFEHKLQSCDFNIGQVVLQRSDGTTVSKQVDLIVGNDGAFSMVRRQMMKTVRFDYQQEYIPHGYMELCIEPTNDNQYAMETNFLHIWPRNEFMMIALPNLDKTFTTTLFMPFEMFDKIQTEEQLLQFFRETFPDSLPLLGEEALIKTYMNSKGLPMISIKCSPYHVGTKAVIMGDAAHAMVPFYGQGMNAGFEDCLVLNELMDKYNNDLSKVLPEYTRIRNVDAKAICDLAMYNYIEMRASVNSKLFLLRKYLDNFLHWLFPKHWVPLYTMVSFTRTRYHEAINKRKWQDKVLTSCNRVLGVATLVGAVFLFRRLAGNTDFSQSAISRLSVLQETVLDHFSKWS